MSCVTKPPIDSSVKTITMKHHAKRSIQKKKKLRRKKPVQKKNIAEELVEEKHEEAVIDEGEYLVKDGVPIQSDNSYYTIEVPVETDESFNTHNDKEEEDEILEENIDNNDEILKEKVGYNEDKVVDDNDNKCTQVSFETLVENQTGGYVKEESRVISDRKSLLEVYGYVNRIRKPGFSIPSIDFSKETVIAVFMGEKTMIKFLLIYFNAF